jgi:putative transposase
MRIVCDGLDVELVEFNGETDMCTCSSLARQHGRFPRRSSGLKGAHRQGSVPRIHRRLCPGCAVTLSPSYSASCGCAPQSIIKQYVDGQARPL